MTRRDGGGPRRGMVLLALALLGWPCTAGASDSGEGQLFARLQTARKERFLQEEFDFTLTVYSRGLTLGREIALLNEETPGLQFRPFRDEGSGREEVNGRVYDAHRFLGRAKAVAPGAFDLRPTVKLSVVVPAGGRGAGARGVPPSPSAEIRERELHPVPLAVMVRALPEAGRPAGFGGAVGSFEFTASLRPSAVAAGEPVTLALGLRGRGNIGSLAAPAVSVASAGERFKIYEPKLLRKDLGEDGSEGRLLVEQVLVPRSPAATPVPAVTFSFFDPERQSYREIVRGPFPLVVRAAAAGGTATAEPPAAAPPAAKPRLPAAIAPLKPEAGGWKRLPLRPRYASPWFLALQFVPLAVVAGLFLALRRRDELARDVDKARRQIAPGAARQGLDAAAEALREGDAARFHEALWQALSVYFGHRLNLRPGEVGGAAVTEGLGRAGLDAPAVARLGEMFSLLEQERFGRPPAAAASLTAVERQPLAGLLGEIERLLEACERTAP